MNPVPRRDLPLIPTAAWVIAVVVAVLAYLGMGALFSWNPGNFAELEHLGPFSFLFPALPAVLLGGYVLLIGFIHNDALRRGMRHALWVWLAILIPNGIGIILYFILRDPMPVHCTACGTAMKPGFGFCPSCGAQLAPACPRCQKVAQAGWTHCAYCGSRL